MEVKSTAIFVSQLLTPFGSNSQADDLIVRFNHEEVRTTHDHHRLLVGDNIQRRSRITPTGRA